MIVVDGRTDAEKLQELLAGGAEEEPLDFKATLDIKPRASKATLDFVKDAVSMCNLPHGGYIVVGVDNSGHAAHDHQAVAVDDFDSAKLRDKIARYVDAPISVVSQSHDVDGRDVVLIYIHPNTDGLPVPMSVDGQYVDDAGKNIKVFTAGEVLVREGTSNRRLRYSHWNRLLTRYREQIQADARRDIDALIRTVVQNLQSGNGGIPAQRVPLDTRMDLTTLAHAVVTAFDAPTTVRVEQFLNTVAAEAQASKADWTMQRESWTRALDAVAVVACQAALYRRDSIFGLAVDALERIYIDADGPDADAAGRLLDVILRIFAIGALAVRRKAQALMPTLVLRPIRVNGHYVYASWIRHGSVQAARANLLQSEDGRVRGGQIISLSYALVAQEAAFRPDYAEDASLSPFEELADTDWLLNSTCEFDLWWCLIAAANREPGAGIGSAFNPSCAAFHQHRSQPTLASVVSDPVARSEAFPHLTDSTVADAIAVVVDVAVGQSHQYGGWWDGLSADPRVEQFVKAHGTGSLPNF